MIKSLSKLIFILWFFFACASNSPKRNLEEEEEIDNCIEFITDIIPTRLENLSKPIDFSKDILPLGYYKPKTKYEFKVCNKNDENDCQLRYSDDENYIVQASDRVYNQVKERYELHGKSINRLKAFVFKYKSVKLRLDEGLIKGENGAADSCKEGYKICGKFHAGQFPP